MITFKTSVESVFDQMKIYVDGEVVKVFSGEHDWMDYAIPVLHDGEHVVKVSYLKDYQGDAGDDTIWVDRIFVAENPEAAIKNNPVYPLAEELAVKPQGDHVREIKIEDATGLLWNTFGPAKYYIANAPTAQVIASLPSMYDPESAFLYTNGNLVPLMDCMQDEGYVLEAAIDSAQTTGYACTAVLLYLDPNGINYQALVMFQDEENVDLLCTYNELGEWTYVDAEENADAGLLLPAQVEYVFRVVDESGAPVEGVMLQICDEATCQVLITDANGTAAMTTAPYAWEMHILMAPEGYSADDSNAMYAPAEGGEVLLVLKKE